MAATLAVCDGSKTDARAEIVRVTPFQEDDASCFKRPLYSIYVGGRTSPGAGLAFHSDNRGKRQSRSFRQRRLAPAKQRTSGPDLGSLKHWMMIL